MNNMLLARAAVFGVGSLLLLGEVLWLRRSGGAVRLGRGALAAILVVYMGVMLFLFANHLRFPLNLDLMESVVLQHIQRAATFQPIYPQPTPEYVPLSYNPLFYVLTAPFAWLLGASLPTARLVAILGALGSAFLMFWIVFKTTRSVWWGFVSLGLFAAAYRVMDVYLDTAHSDSWLLCTALLGSYLISLKRSRTWNMAGIVVLVASFWFKQHGALFLLGGLAYLTWLEGRRSLIYWGVAALLGPVLYLLAGPVLFGPAFHFFTWQTPRGWTELNVATVSRYLRFIVISYLPLALVAGAYALWSLLKPRQRLTVWVVQFGAALLSGFMGSLDPGSSNNVYITMGAWFILLGVLGLSDFSRRLPQLPRYGLDTLVLIATLTLLLYDPRPLVVSAEAPQRYQELVTLLEGLNGPVYAPSLGQLPSGYTLSPAAHWVALEDMIRGPGIDTRNNPLTRRLLDPALHPSGAAFILANYPVEAYPWLEFLNETYVLDTDLGDRFRSLGVLPKRWDHGFPRYLYRLKTAPPIQ